MIGEGGGGGGGGGWGRWRERPSGAQQGESEAGRGRWGGGGWMDGLTARTFKHNRGPRTVGTHVFLTHQNRFSHSCPLKAKTALGMTTNKICTYMCVCMIITFPYAVLTS